MTGYFTLFGEQSIFFLLLIMFKQDKRKQQERKQLRENLNKEEEYPQCSAAIFFLLCFLVVSRRVKKWHGACSQTCNSVATLGTSSAIQAKPSMTIHPFPCPVSGHVQFDTAGLIYTNYMTAVMDSNKTTCC